MSDTDGPTFQRCPHDKENPYVMVNTDLIRDNSISPECRWLIIYLLSNKEGWQVKTKQIISHLEGHCGRDKVRSLVKEAIEAGYIKREDTSHGNLRRCIYFVSETPKFKKSFPRTDFQGPGAEGPANKGDKVVSSSSKEEHKKEQYNICPTSSSSSADAELLTDFFIKKIKERKPDFKDPNREKWTKEFDRMIRIDKRMPEEIKSAIIWAAEDNFWKANCLSPESLRKNYDKFVLNLSANQEKVQIRKNRDYVLEMQKKYPEPLKDLTFDSKYVINRRLGKEVSLYLSEEPFQEAFISLFRRQNV